LSAVDMRQSFMVSPAPRYPFSRNRCPPYVPHEVVPTARAQAAASPAHRTAGRPRSIIRRQHCLCSGGGARRRGGGRPARRACGRGACVSGGDDTWQVRVWPVLARPSRGRRKRWWWRRWSKLCPRCRGYMPRRVCRQPDDPLCGHGGGGAVPGMLWMGGNAGALPPYRAAIARGAATIGT